MMPQLFVNSSIMEVMDQMVSALITRDIAKNI